MEDTDIPVFVTKVRQTGSSLEITLDSKVCKFEGIQLGDFVKVIVRKMQKKEG